MPNGSTAELAARLGRVRHFQGLPVATLQTIVSAGQIRRFAAQEMIFGEGEPCAGMFVLLGGRVRIFRTGLRGHEQIMTFIEPVIMFNEVAVLDGGPNPVSALAETDCLTWVIGCQAFNVLLRDIPEVGLGLLPVLAERNRLLVAQNAEMSAHPVLERTASLLLRLSHDGRQPIYRRQHSIDQMAARIGTVREPLSRSLKALREAGLIAVTRETIAVLRPGDLARQARGCLTEL